MENHTERLGARHYEPTLLYKTKTKHKTINQILTKTKLYITKLKEENYKPTMTNFTLFLDNRQSWIHVISAKHWKIIVNS